MSTHLSIKLELNDMIWTSEPRNVLSVVREYCPFINSGELASELTEKALMINQAYKNGAPANELDAQMVLLKQRATGLTVTDAKAMHFIPNYSETLGQLPYHRAAVGIDLLTDLESSYE